jgi:hypothetical protein
LHAVITSPHAAVPFSWPQLCGVTHLQLAMHSPGDSDPFGSGLHWPTVALQLYVTGLRVGLGVGFGVGAKQHWLAQ